MIMTRELPLHFDPPFVEKAVFLAEHERPSQRGLEKLRNRVYQVADPDRREKLFAALYLSWFERLGLGQIIRRALNEQTLLHPLIANCYIVCATQASQEGAELFVAPDGASAAPRRTLRVLLRPESLLNAPSALAFLRHELFHIADMLDPAFGYEPALPKTDGGPSYDKLIVDRYRVLWDTAIAGRMVRRGWLPAAVRHRQLEDFRLAFVMLPEAAEACFARFFDGEQPSHKELAAFAFDPRGAAGEPATPSSAHARCPLCKFPTHAFEPAAEHLAAEIIAAIARDFAHWRPAQGLCVQCADLYRTRQLSLAAASALPGWNHSSVR